MQWWFLMQWWFFPAPFFLVQLLLPALMSIVWLSLRFGDRRRVPIAFYVVALLCVVACCAAGLGLMSSQTPADDPVTGAGDGFVIMFWFGNGQSGAVVLGVLAIVALVSHGLARIRTAQASTRATHH